MTENKFSELKISSEICRAISLLGYDKPTQVQAEAIPFLLAKKDIIVKSQTGSGKTAAFGIPLCETIEWEERAPQALVLTPTRELALQIQNDLFHIGRFKRLKVEAVFGRSPFAAQERQLKQRTHIIVATPGRLLDHLERGTVDLSKIETVVIDEADEMLDMGFIEQIEKVLNQVPSSATKALFSATMPHAIKQLVEEYLVAPEFIEVQVENKVQNRIAQYFYRTPEEAKIQLLLDVVVVDNPTTCIVFCNTKLAVEEVTESLTALGAKPEMLHGGMEQRDRTRIIQEYKQGYFRYLVATDVAARGLDIADVDMVINFDLPNSNENYTHRIGRTARFEKLGKAISFVNEYDDRRFDSISDNQEQNLTELKAPKESLVIDKMSSFTAKQERAPKLKKTKELVFKDEIMKLHINAGKKTKMRAGDVVGALCSIDGMTGEDIGVISIADVSTFVEILNGKGEKVLKALQDVPVKGRTRRVSKANESNYEKDIKKS